jgi:hypothetical protein
LIADIPLIGDLFRYDFTENRRAELLIILTPHVIRSPADMQRIKQIESSRLHWCAADVHALHGDHGFCGRLECPLCEADVPVIYPDLNPRGVVFGEPAESPLESPSSESPSSELPSSELPSGDLAFPEPAPELAPPPESTGE